MALDRARKAPPFGDSGHVHLLADFEDADVDRLADVVSVHVIDPELTHHARRIRAGFFEVPRHRFVDLTLGTRAETNLKSAVAVRGGSLDLKHAAGTDLNHRHGHDRPSLVVNAAHA